MTDPVLWIILVIALLLLASLWMRGRLRLQREQLRSKQCPKCSGTEWHRVHRRLSDHLFGVGMNVRRFRCANQKCGNVILYKRS